MQTKWEYLVIDFYIGGLPADSDLRRENKLKDLGVDGWELTAVITRDNYHVAYLKRPLGMDSDEN